MGEFFYINNIPIEFLNKISLRIKYLSHCITILNITKITKTANLDNDLFATCFIIPCVFLRI